MAEILITYFQKTTNLNADESKVLSEIIVEKAKKRIMLA